MTMEYEFSAFISYKRGEDDEKAARAVQRRLESYRIPVADLPAEAKSGGIPGRLKVFRDKSDLGSHANLAEGLSENLGTSRFLIVICSERSAQSPYVDEEVRHFVESGRSDNIIPLIIGGQAMPPSMPEGAAPITAENREETFIRLLSRILRVDYDNLWVAHLRAHRRRAFRWFSLVAAVAVLTVSLGLWAVSAAKRATALRLEAEELVDFLVYEITGSSLLYLPYYKMELATDLVRQYYESWAPGEPKAHRAAAFNRRALAYGAITKGDLVSALEMTAQSVEILDSMCRRDPKNEDYLSDYADVLEEAGNLSVNLKQAEKAEEYYKKSVEISKKIGALSPDSLIVKTAISENLMTLANFLSSEERFNEADVLFGESVEIWEKIFEFSADESETLTVKEKYADFLSKCAEFLLVRENYAGALGFYNKSLAIYKELLGEYPENFYFRMSYAVEFNFALAASLNAEEIELADTLYEEGEKQLRHLSEDYPQPLYLQAYSLMLAEGGELRVKQGRPEDALELLNKAERILDRLLDEDPENESYTSLKTQIESLCEEIKDSPP
jgi:tetratricopeptide (TPR) repeat protein